MTSSLLLLALVAAAARASLTPSTYMLAPGDRERLTAALSIDYAGADPELVFYSVKGFSLLGAKPADVEGACGAVTGAVDTTSVRSMYLAAATGTMLKSLAGVDCQFNQAITEARDTLAAAVASSESSTETLAQALATQAALGHKLAHQAAAEALAAALARDDSPLAHAHAFLAAETLAGGKVDVSRFHDAIEDVAAQADEIDDRLLQFEGGLHTTALVVESAFRLSAAVKVKPTLSEAQVLKLTNYLLSRRRAGSLKAAVGVLAALNQLATNAYHLPVCVSLASAPSINANAPTVSVRVTNTLGGALASKPLTVTAVSAKHTGDDAVVLSKAAFTPVAGDATLYTLDFMTAAPAAGFYKLAVSAAPADKPDARLLGGAGAELEVKVTAALVLADVQITLADRDGAAAPHVTPLAPPTKLSGVVEADSSQKLGMAFRLRPAVAAHQTFVRLTHGETGREIIFVAEQEAGGLYKFELDVTASAKDFGSLSGMYAMDVVVGDAVVDNPLQWTAADVKLSFASSDSGAASSRYAPLPVIEHQFREAEPRPPAGVSRLFTALVIAPLVLMLALWVVLGANLGNLSVTPASLAFHVLLASVFGLYYMYWTRLDMFETLRYLAVLGAALFLVGHRLLSSLAAARKQ